MEINDIPLIVKFYFTIFALLITQFVFASQSKSPKASEPTPNGLSCKPFAVGVFNFMEIWKDIDGYKGYYQISNLGRVKSLGRTIIRSNGIKQTFRERILKQDLNFYPQVFLAKDGLLKPFRIHRLLAEYFIPNPGNKPEVNHKDGNKLNNSLDNLEWATSCENIKHAFNTGLHRKSGQHPQAKKIRQLTRDGELIKIWDCMNDIPKMLTGYKQGNISSACLGKIKICYGFKWEFV